MSTVITDNLAASLRRMPDTTTADHIIAALGMVVTTEYSRVDLWAADLPGLSVLLVIEHNRSGARAAGWLLSHGQDPAQVPVLLERGLRWQLLTAEGSYAPVPPEDTGQWCVYITGMDDLIPMPDRAMAERRATHFNQWSEEYQKQRDPSRDWPVPRAEVKPWPYAPADHAEALAELRDDDPDGWLLEPATPETPRVAHRSF
jgi:hypothetical protein